MITSIHPRLLSRAAGRRADLAVQRQPAPGSGAGVIAAGCFAHRLGKAADITRGTAQTGTGLVTLIKPQAYPRSRYSFSPIGA